MIYYCYKDISCVDSEDIQKMKDYVLLHVNGKVNLKNSDSVAVKYLLCCMIEEIFGLKDYRIISGKNGKLYLEKSSVYFSLSHSEDIIFCVVAESEVGCDVQLATEYKEKISKRFFTNEENEVICQTENKQLCFAKLWTFKESILKYTGKGLSGGLSTYDFSDCILKNHFNKYELNFTTFYKNEYVFSFCAKETESILYQLKTGGI